MRRHKGLPPDPIVDAVVDAEKGYVSFNTEPDKLLDLAWGVIANAGWDGLDKTDGWQDAAVRWRERYHAYLDSGGSG